MVVVGGDDDDGENGGGERGGDIQRERLLHVFGGEEASEWYGSQSHRLRARPDSLRPPSPLRSSRLAAATLRRRETAGPHTRRHGLAHQRNPSPSPQGRRCSLALISLSLSHPRVHLVTLYLFLF